ncbi:carbohydrate ABC transporter permease [Paenibacillus lignilyticus]|nr:sugar ABC transporter permease [Paenibacillus lignilyticus]
MQPTEAIETGKHRVNVVWGTILSTLFMGLGQIYNRQYVKGIGFFLLEIYFIFIMSHPITKGIIGVITLGDQPQVRSRGRIVTIGDHSIFLLISGIICIITLALFLFVYYLNIRDAHAVGKRREAGLHVNSFREMVQNIKEKGFPYVLLIPSIIFTAFLTILPLLFGVLIAFTNYSGPDHLPPKNLVDWTGLDTFKDLFSLKSWSQTFYGVFAWTIVWAVVSTLTTFCVGLLYALMINYRRVRFKKLWRGILILPWAIPTFISLLIFRNIFNGAFGPLNQYLKMLSISPIPWLSDPIWTKTAIIITNIWIGFPFWLILMSGVLTGIDKELYEAAEIDGASTLNKFKSITLPLVMFSTLPLLIMSFAGNINNFNIIYLLNTGGPVESKYSYAGSTDILISWIYKLTLDNSKFNVASAVSIIVFIIIAALSIWNFRRTKVFKEEDMLS